MDKKELSPTSLFGSTSNLIKVLESSSSRNLAAQNCRSVQDCLHTVAKNFPARSVSQLLEDKGQDENISSTIVLDTSNLRVAFGSLLTGPLECIRNAGKGEEQAPISTINAMQHLVLVLDFLQLLLELYGKSNSINTNESKENNNKNKRINVKETDLLDIIQKLLRALVGVVSGSLESTSNSAAATIDPEDDEDDRYEREFSHHAIMVGPYQPRLVAYFGWHFLLRLNHAYIPNIPKCLNPFWKALSELTSAISVESKLFPPAMTHEALKELVGFLRQGTLPIVQSILVLLPTNGKRHSQQDPDHPSQVPLVRFKMLTFFLGRTQFFLQRLVFDPETDGSNNKRVRNLGLLLEQLSIWKGMERWLLSSFGSSMTSFAALDQELKSAAERAQRCWDLLDDQATALVRAGLIPRLPRTKSHEKEESRDKQTAIYAAALGKASFLLHAMMKSRRVLEEPIDVDSWENLEDLLNLVRALTFQALPVCLSIQHQQQHQRSDPKKTLRDYCDSFFAECIPEITQALGLIVTFEQHQHRIHRLLVSWLGRAASSDCHPLTRGAFLVIFVQTIMDHCDTEAVHELMYLMVQLLIDVRTLRPLRIIVATVLRRFLTYWKSPASSSTPGLDALGRQVGYWLIQDAKELAQQWQPKSPKKKKDDTKKRKRKREPLKTVRLLDSSDLHLIGQVLLVVSGDCELHEKLQEFHLETGNHSITKSRKRQELFLAALSIYCNISDSPSARQLVPLICSNRFPPRMNAALDALSIALLLRQSSSQGESLQTMRNSEFQCLLELASHVTAISDERRKASLLPAVILFLGSIGRTVPPNPSEDLLNRLSKTCHQAFAPCSWYQTAFCVSSMDRFSRQVPEKYKHKLPACIPSAPRTLMTCRYQKKPFIPVSLKEVSRLDVIQRQYHQHLARLCKHTSRHPKSVFPSPSSLTVPEGSYIISMPTREGRSATVIFDPCKASLEDIAYMMDGSENEADIRQLKRVIIQERGGCKLFLNSPK